MTRHETIVDVASNLLNIQCSDIEPKVTTESITRLFIKNDKPDHQNCEQYMMSQAVYFSRALSQYVKCSQVRY